MAGHGLLGMRVDATMGFFPVGRVGDDHILGAWNIPRPHLSDVLVVNDDLLLPVIFIDIFPGNGGQFFLYFNGGDTKIGGSQAENQRNDTATAANVHDFVPGAGLGLGREHKGIHGKSIPVLGLADVEFPVKKMFNCAGLQF